MTTRSPKKRPPSPENSPSDKRRRSETRMFPTRVVHIRNIASNADEVDVIQLGLPFGRVSNILMLKQKNQAFLEFEKFSSAETMVNYFLETEQPVIGGRTVFVQFSEHKELRTDASHSNSSAKTQAALKAATSLLDRGVSGGNETGKEPAGNVLHVFVDNQIYPVSLSVIITIFGAYGTIVKILTFDRNRKLQALIEYDSAPTASRVRRLLDGNNIYNGCCTLRILASPLRRVVVTRNNDFGWDFTNPNLPSGDGAIHPRMLLEFGGADSPERDARLLSPSISPPKSNVRSSPNIFGAVPRRALSRPVARRPDRQIYRPPVGKFGVEGSATDSPDLDAAAGFIGDLLLGLLDVSPSSGDEAERTVDPRKRQRQSGGPRRERGGEKSERGREQRRGGAGSVLLVSNLPASGVTPDNLFTLFGVYGDVNRVKILFNKKDAALVQMADAAMADLARRHLHRLVVWGQTLSVKTSKHASIASPKDDRGSDEELTKDYFNSPLHRYKKAGSKNCANIFPPSASLHLSNIAAGVTEDQLVDAFAHHGSVVSFKFFNLTQKMGILEMASTQEAVDALVHLHNRRFKDQHLRVSFAKSPVASSKI